jgi:hypothetical protein
MELAATLKPDVLLLDLLMPDEGAFSQEDVKQHFFTTPVASWLSPFGTTTMLRNAQKIWARKPA